MDTVLRDLARAAETGDSAAERRLEVEQARVRGEPPRLSVEQALALSLCLLDAVAPLTGWRHRGRLVRCACPSRCRTWGWRTDAGAKQADPVEARGLARELAAAVERASNRQYEARAADARERARVEAEREAAEFTALVARTPRALGWVDVWETRDLAERTATVRCAIKAMILLAVASARENGHATAEADHVVARSYKYPVAYSRVSARRVAESRDVRVTVTRTQTWGRREDTSASIVVPAELPTVIS